jgi:hypothetical protein
MSRYGTKKFIILSFSKNALSTSVGTNGKNFKKCELEKIWKLQSAFIKCQIFTDPDFRFSGYFKFKMMLKFLTINNSNWSFCENAKIFKILFPIKKNNRFHTHEIF